MRLRVRKARLAIDNVDLLQRKRFAVRDGRYEPQDWSGLKARFGTFMANLRRFGITGLAEGRTLKDEEEDFARYVKPHPVATLENASLRVHVAPELNGRIIQIIDKKTGLEALRNPYPGEVRYPDLDGLSVSISADGYGSPSTVDWQLASTADRSGLTLAGSGDGLKLRRSIALSSEGPLLRTETAVENTGTAPREVVVQSQWVFNPGTGDPDVSLSYLKRDGTRVEKRILAPDLPWIGSEILVGPDCAGGEWRLMNRALGLTLVSRFPKEQVARCSARWRARGENRLTASVWSHQRKLAPNEALRLELNYLIETGRGRPSLHP